MKRSKGLFAICLTALFGFGVAAGLTVSKNVSEKVEIADAIGAGNIYVRCTRPTGWGDTLKCHYWGGSSESSWPGIDACATYNNSYGQTVFIFEIPSNSTGLLFDNGNWQTNNLTLNDIGNCWYLGTNIPNDRSDFGTWSPSTYTVNVYDANNTLDGNVYLYSFRGQNCDSGHVKMSTADYDYLSDKFYTIQVDEMYSNMIVTSGSWSAQTSDQTPDSSKFFVIESKTGSTLNGSYYDNNDYVYAMDWVNYEMHLKDIPTSNKSDTGKCRGASGYYQKAKNAYNTYTGIKSQVQYVSGYQDAFDRFEDWATANGETASFASGTFELTTNKNGSFNPNFSNNDGSVAASIIVSTIMVTALGGYFLLKKKRI